MQIARSFYQTLFVASVLGAPAHLFAQTVAPMDEDDAEDVLEEVDRDIAQMKRDVTIVAQGYEEPLSLSSGARVERRLRQAEVHFILDDYLRASIVLLDVVEDPKNQSHPRYDDCVFLLAEALRKTKHYSGAKRYFESLLERSSGDRQRDVIIALLEIANQTRRYDRVEELVDRLRNSGALARPDVDYIQGKTLFSTRHVRPENVERAYTLFKGVPAGSVVGPQAAYYAGVTLVELGEYERALAEFNDALTRAKQNPKKWASIIELAHLSLGRLNYELGRVPQAVDHYQQVGRGSENFSEMLFEVAWAHVKSAAATEDEKEKRAALERALQTADLLMATQPGPLLFPEARILEGNLQIRVRSDETAYDTFQSIIDRYGGVRTKLGQIIEGNPDPRGFVEQLVKQDLEAVSATAFVPPLALDWAVRAPAMRRAVGMIRDLQDAERYQTESEELLEVLVEALRGEQKYGMFGALATSRAKAFSVENRTLLNHRRLLETERALVAPYLDQSSLDRLNASYAKRQQIEKELNALPQSEGEIELFKGEIQGAYQALERRVFKLSYKLSSMRAQAIAVEVWLNQNRGRLSKAETQKLQKEIDDARAKVQGMEADMTDLQTEIRASSQIYGGDAGRRRTKRLRRDYDAIIADESQLLSSLRMRLPGNLQSLLSRIDGQRSSLGRIQGDLSELQSALDGTVDDRVSQISEQLAIESDRLAQYRQEYAELRKSTDQVLGPITQQALQTVAEQFKELELKADVGIIDVAWARKQQTADEVSDLVRRQNEKVRELDLEFAEILEGE